jgi:hypothetical protein
MNEEQQTDSLDRDRIENLMASILVSVRENFVRGPISRDRCFEALNALAAAAALVIRGSDGPHAVAHDFFTKALNQHIDPTKFHEYRTQPKSPS